MAKRKRSSGVDMTVPPRTTMPIVPLQMPPPPPPPCRRTSQRKSSQANSFPVDANPDTNSQVLDGSQALRASPDAEEEDEKFNVEVTAPIKKSRKAAPAAPKSKTKSSPSDSSLSDLSDVDTRATSVTNSQAAAPSITKAPLKETFVDPEADEGDEPVDEAEIKAASLRPPPVDSDYLPLPWKGRLGYACLNTYLRAANPPIFSSRTCRIASILENRHPLADPSQPAHATKNRPDKDQPASIARGQRYVESIGVANARDIPKMLRWNDRYGIKFLRLSSEMFPFASHEEYGYKLAPFASEALAEAGRVAAELGHRLTTHPGQFTQLGSPRKSVIENAFRDLEYHAELLSLLKLPEQQNRDAVMILHLGGVFGDKAATLDRFRENYAKVSQNVKNRLVLENDDMSWSVHDLLPICEELNIPMVLDFHHHNIIFDETQIREGSLDIMNLYDRIAATWKRKNITQKMHYSEPTPPAITGQQRRKHSPRVKTLPPCPPTMDLMIEAKDKEQAVFELMRIFKLPGWDTFHDVTPHSRADENRPWNPPKKKKTPKKKKGEIDLDVDAEAEPEPQPPPIVPDEEVNMGGPEGRVYWPPGQELWLKPKKREIKKKDPVGTPASTKKSGSAKKEPAIKTEELAVDVPIAKDASPTNTSKPKKAPIKATITSAKQRSPTPLTSDEEMSDLDALSELGSESDVPTRTTKEVKKPGVKVAPPSRRQSGRGAKAVMRSYTEVEEDEDVDMD